MDYNISSIQQVGLGSAEVRRVWNWYKKHFRMAVPIFDEAAEAPLMIPYTGGEIHQRHAILGLNKNGGGGIEFWQFKSRNSDAPGFKILPGDLGISTLWLKSTDINIALELAKKANIDINFRPGDHPLSAKSFGFVDPFGNQVAIKENDDWYRVNKAYKSGGVLGVSIGVSNIEKSIFFYRDILNFDIVGDIQEGTFADLDQVSGGKYKYKRVLLKHSEKREGPFAKLLGRNEIELIQVLDRIPKKIFGDRYWGDQGFIHLCFDVQRMEGLKDKCAEAGHPFTVDSSNSFDMGKAAGRFAYCEDPDGTLIEFVETHKIPILPKLGWYYTLSKTEIKHLPDFLIRLMLMGEKK
jgi:catechol 2,3-dioxygenase-like lactoylglutathione lyase family enzyme